MVELDPEDYSNILNWFEATFGKRPLENLSLDDKRTFWKLTFLAEDRMKEIKEETPPTD